MVLVRDIMSREVLKISESASVAELTSILTRHRITGLPVLDSKGKLVGVVSEFDVIDRRGKTVGGIMSPQAQTLRPPGPPPVAVLVVLRRRASPRPSRPLPERRRAGREVQAQPGSPGDVTRRAGL